MRCNLTFAAIATAPLLGCPGLIRAQSPLLYIDWSWSEVVAGTTTPVPVANSILEPGESVLLKLSLRFEPPVGTILSIPGFPEATVAGFLGVSIAAEGGVPNLGIANGQFSHLWGDPQWTGLVGSAWPGLSYVSGITFWAGWPISGPPDPANPVDNLWRAVWTPPDYEPRLMRYSSGYECCSGLWLYFRTGIDPSTGQPVYAVHNFAGPQFQQHSMVHVPIVPAPGASLLSIATLGAVRRRRRRCT